MSHLAPRPPSQSAHRRTPSNSQPPDKRLELVAKVEICIGEILEATKAYKSPQQHSAHQNVNQMFQQRLMATRGHMGKTSDQDWLGTMMQCLNESMRTQQSSFVRNTNLDVALKTFASGVFEALGVAYFQESFDRHMAQARHNPASNATAESHTQQSSGIPSPPREMAPSQNPIPRHNPKHMPPPPTHAPSFPSAHSQLVQRPAAAPRPAAAAFPHHQMHGMPLVQHPLPQTFQQGRPAKRPSPNELPNAPARKRAYTSEALRQAAGPVGPSHQPGRSGSSHNILPKQRLCIDYWDVQQERDARRRQAILSYDKKWYVFQCHQHHESLFFKTAEGARHHMITRHALPNQNVDFLDIIQTLGVEVMNCDVARAEKNNVEAASMWNRMSSNPVSHQNAGARPVRLHMGFQLPTANIVPTIPAPRSPAQQLVSAPLPIERISSPGVVLLSDDEAGIDQGASQPTVAIKQEGQEENNIFAAHNQNLMQPSDVESVSMPAPEVVSQTTGQPGDQVKVLSTPHSTEQCSGNSDGPKTPPSSVKVPNTAFPQAESIASEKETTPAACSAEAVSAEQIPELSPDSPESSDLSEPPSIDELDAFDLQPTKNEVPQTLDAGLEEGEIDETCIKVASCSPKVSHNTISSPESGKKKKRRISAAGSAPSTPARRRRKLPSTPSSLQKTDKGKRSLWSPPKEAGPSAHDQFKTKACKKCSERFYFRAQLATHMRSEHPDVIIIE